MAELDLNLSFYKTPSDEILRHRRAFYVLWKRCDDHPTTWLNRVQSQINRCEFPPLMSHEFLLVDKFACEVDDEYREFIQSVDTWTLDQLMEYFSHQKVDGADRVNRTDILVNNIPMKCELVSKLKTQIIFFSVIIYTPTIYSNPRILMDNHKIL